MGKLEDEAKAAAEYARGPRRVPEEYARGPISRPASTAKVLGPGDVITTPFPTASVTPLKVPKQPTLTDEILQMLDELVADIRSGKVSPCYLILGFGEDTTRDGQPAEEYSWDSTGLNRRELVGHLMTYVSKLSVDEA